MKDSIFYYIPSRKHEYFTKISPWDIKHCTELHRQRNFHLKKKKLVKYPTLTDMSPLPKVRNRSLTITFLADRGQKIHLS